MDASCPVVLAPTAWLYKYLDALKSMVDATYDLKLSR